VSHAGGLFWIPWQFLLRCSWECRIIFIPVLLAESLPRDPQTDKNHLPPPPSQPGNKGKQGRTPTFSPMLVRTPPPRKMHIWISLIETPGSASKLRSEFKILIRCMHHWLYHVSVLELFLIKEGPAVSILSLNNYTRRGPHLYSRRRWSVGQTVRRRSFLMYIFNLLVMRGKMIVL
jgi:hypothetical protein